MFEKWYVLRFEYACPENTDKRTKAVGYLSLDEAVEIFRKMELSYQYDVAMRVKGGALIKITAAGLYEVFEFYRKDAIADVDLGKGVMLYEARDIEIDLP